MSSEDLTEAEAQNEAPIQDDLDADVAENIQQKYDELNDKYIRLYADFENIRRRHATEKVQIAQHVKVDLVTSFLPCIDDIERGIASIHSHELKSEQVLEGLTMVHNKIIDVLVNSWNITLLGTVGELFDPRFHEALSMVEDEQYAQETIVEVYQRGYKLQDRVIKPAKVLISKPKVVTDSGEAISGDRNLDGTNEGIEE